MAYVSLHEHLPELAERETRSITVFPGSNVGLPAGDYGFIEMFCDEAGCDCRRVFFWVVSSVSRKVEAVIAYGWEPRSFYVKWLGFDDPRVIRDLKGPALNLGSPQSSLAPAILDLVRSDLLQDAEYVERIKRPYRVFRDQIEGDKRLRRKRKA